MDFLKKALQMHMYNRMGSTPAGIRLNKILRMINIMKPNSAKTTFEGAVDNSGMYGSYSGRFAL